MYSTKMVVDKFGRYSGGRYNKTGIKKGILSTLRIKLDNEAYAINVQGQRITNLGNPIKNDDSVTVNFLKKFERDITIDLRQTLNKGIEDINQKILEIKNSFNKDIEEIYKIIKETKDALYEDLAAQKTFCDSEFSKFESYIFNYIVTKPVKVMDPIKNAEEKDSGRIA